MKDGAVDSMARQESEPGRRAEAGHRLRVLGAGERAGRSTEATW